MPLALQAKLLRVIQARTFERVGSSESTRVDVRIVAATNRNLEAEVTAGRFRADLFYRLNVLPIHIPPLRERREDIPPLAAHFLRKHSRATKKQIRGFSDAAMELLLSYAWPGNVRELENSIERAVVFSREELIGPEALTLSAGGAGEDSYAQKTLREALTVFKKHFITRALEANGWHQTRTAKTLAIQRSYLSRLVRELDIMKERGV
jgi:Nif-specific regulatory protein